MALDPKQMLKGEEIYRAKYKSAYEVQHPDEFPAIDVTTGDAYPADEPERALELAQQGPHTTRSISLEQARLALSG